MYQKDLSLSQGIYEDPIMYVKIQQANIISKKKKNERYEELKLNPHAKSCALKCITEQLHKISN